MPWYPRKLKRRPPKKGPAVSPTTFVIWKKRAMSTLFSPYLVAIRLGSVASSMEEPAPCPKRAMKDKTKNAELSGTSLASPIMRRERVKREVPSCNSLTSFIF